MVKQLCELLNLSKLVNGLKGSQCREAESLSADSRKRSSLRKKTFDNIQLDLKETIKMIVQLLSKPGRTVFGNVGEREILSLKE